MQSFQKADLSLLGDKSTLSERPDLPSIRSHDKPMPSSPFQERIAKLQLSKRSAELSTVNHSQIELEEPLIQRAQPSSTASHVSSSKQTRYLSRVASPSKNIAVSSPAASVPASGSIRNGSHSRKRSEYYHEPIPAMINDSPLIEHRDIMHGPRYSLDYYSREPPQEGLYTSQPGVVPAATSTPGYTIAREVRSREIERDWSPPRERLRSLLLPRRTIYRMHVTGLVLGTTWQVSTIILS